MIKLQQVLMHYIVRH